MKLTFFIGSFVLLAIYFTIAEAGERQQGAWIRAVTPAENAEIISKKPDVKIEFLEPIVFETLVVLLDGTDITQLLAVTEKGFEYKPLLVMPSGMHNLSITARDKEGRQLEKSISFTTRHSSTFEEVTTNADITGLYSSTLKKDPEDTVTPYNRVEGIGQVQAKLKEGLNELSLEGTAIYIDQDKPLLPSVSPMTQAIKKGFDVRNFVLGGEYKGEALRLKAGAGDVQISETPYTVQGLMRRGGHLILGYKDAEVSFFSVRASSIYGLRHGFGIRLDKENQIMGSSFKLSLPFINSEIKIAYLTGEDSSALSYGISSANGKRKGDAVSLMLTSRPIEDKLVVDFEVASSRFDQDTSDEFGKISDKAWRLGFSGNIERYFYEAKYEYLGRDFQSLGIQGEPKDREGISLRGGATFTDHRLNLTFTRYNDNVKDDPVMPKTLNYQAILDYNFTHFMTLPIGISLQRNVTDSTREPTGFDPIKTVADSITGRITYTLPKWSIGPSISYTISDDKTHTNADNTSTTYTVALSLNPVEGLVVSSSPSLIQRKDKITDVRTDTYTTNFDIRSEVKKKLVFLDIGGTYSVIKASDNSQNSWNTMFNTRLAYSLKKYFPEYLSPNIALTCNYNRNKNRLTGTGEERYTIFLVIELLSAIRL